MALFLRERGCRAAALVGGYDGWRDEGLPLVNDRTASNHIGRCLKCQVDFIPFEEAVVVLVSLIELGPERLVEFLFALAAGRLGNLAIVFRVDDQHRVL